MKNKKSLTIQAVSIHVNDTINEINYYHNKWQRKLNKAIIQLNNAAISASFKN